MLLWSARPQLVRDIEATKTIWQNTANPDVIVAPQNVRWDAVDGYSKRLFRLTDG